MKKKVSKKKTAAKKPLPVYNDPLHVPYSKLVVTYRGKEVYMMNKALLDRQNCWENLDAIKEAHVRKLMVYELIEKETDKNMLKKLAVTLTDIEFELQALWKFSIDANFHRIWEYPKCECPVIDNRERYPHGHIIVASCPLHGWDTPPPPKLTLWQKIKKKLSDFWASTKKAMSEIDHEDFY